VETKAHIAPALPLDQQIQYLGELADRIHNQIGEYADFLPADTLESLDRLSDQLARLTQKITEREAERNDLLALANIGRAINSSLDLNEVLRIVMDTIVQLTGAERGFLMLRDGRGELSIHIARNWEQETLAEDEFAVSQTVINSVIEDCQPVLTTNAQRDPRFGDQDSIIAYNLRSILSVPIRLRGELIGVIYVDNRVRTGLFTESDRGVLMAVADQAAVAIENARLFESIHKTLVEVTELKSLMDDVFASIASGVITIDGLDTITLCNNAATSILAKEGERLVGEKFTSILPGIAEDLARYLEYVRRTGSHLVGIELTPVIPSRGSVTLSFNLAPLQRNTTDERSVAIVVEDQTEKKRLETQHLLFERMVSPAVIDQLAQNENLVSVKRAHITILFADIRGFTHFSEQHDPELLVQVLNRYLGGAVEAVLTQEGTVDKFLGDAMMAFFNAPVPQRDHTLKAARAAIGIRKSMQELQRELDLEFHLAFSIGIHYGEAVLGFIGTDKRMEYTAIGDSVNTTKRIQENAVAGQILISADAFDQIRDHVVVRPVAPIRAKGKRKPISVFEITDLI
jgi:adenylate cyclase